MSATSGLTAGPTAKKSPALLLVGSQMTVGGAQKMLLEQARWFAAHGYQVTAAFLYDRDGLQADWQAAYPFPVLDLGFRRSGAGKLSNLFRFASGLLRLARLLFSGHFQVVETFTHHSSLVGMPLAWLARVPARIAGHHGRFHSLSRLQSRLHAWAINLRLASCLVAVSQAVCHDAIAEGVRRDRIHVIRNGIRLAEPAPGARSRIRAELGIDPDVPLVITVGRLAPEKDQSTLLRAFHSLRSCLPSAHLVLAGDGPLRTVLEREAASLDLAGAVHFLGARADVPDLLAAADLFTITSVSEGFPLALLEAMGQGLPVISTRVGGMIEVITDGVDGRFVPPTDAPALAQAMLDLLRQPAVAAQLGQAARAEIANRFSIDRMCEQYAQLFRQQG